METIYALEDIYIYIDIDMNVMYKDYIETIYRDYVYKVLEYTQSQNLST